MLASMSMPSVPGHVAMIDEATGQVGEAGVDVAGALAPEQDMALAGAQQRRAERVADARRREPLRAPVQVALEVGAVVTSAEGSGVGARVVDHDVDHAVEDRGVGGAAGHPVSVDRGGVVDRVGPRRGIDAEVDRGEAVHTLADKGGGSRGHRGLGLADAGSLAVTAEAPDARQAITWEYRVA